MNISQDGSKVLAMKYQVFKNELRCYRDYKKTMHDAQERIDDIIYQYAGVRGISYDKITMSFNENLAIEQRERMFKALTEPQKEYDHAQRMVERIENNLSKLDSKMRVICMALFCDGYSYEHMGNIYGYSARGLWKKVKKEIEKI